MGFPTAALTRVRLVVRSVAGCAPSRNRIAARDTLTSVTSIPSENLAVLGIGSYPIFYDAPTSDDGQKSIRCKTIMGSEVLMARAHRPAGAQVLMTSKTLWMLLCDRMMAIDRTVSEGKDGAQTCW